MPQLIVEECTRGGAHVAYYAVDRFPLRIGRAFDNDIVLADPFVSPLHLVITDGGDAWMLDDRSSENGTFIGKGERLTGPMCAGSGDQITLGKTVLRLWSPHHPVGRTQIFPTRRSIVRRAVTPALALASLLVAGAMVILQQHLDTEKKTALVTLVAGSIPYLSVPLLWAGLWAVAGFIVRRHAQFALQLLVGNVVYILFIALSLAVEYIDYMSGSVAVADTFQYAGDAVLATALLFINMSLAGGMNDLRRGIVSVLVGGGVVAAVAVSDHAESGENRLLPVYSHTLKPISGRFSHADSLDQFIAEGGKIFGEEGSGASNGRAEP
jgi:hypothetical protein